MTKRKIACLLILFMLSFIGTPETMQAQTEKFNMTYLNYGTTASLLHNIDMTKDSLQSVSPNYFMLNSDGTLGLTETLDAEFIKDMKSRGIKLVPFLGNDWNRDLGRQALQNRDVLSSQIADAVQKYQLDGINVDIENLPPQDRDLHTDFIKKLRAKLPAGTELSVAIPAEPGGMSAASVYDNQVLSEYVDYLLLMAYDEHYPGDPDPGPVASLPFVDKSIQQALKQIPADKLVLGIPFYGRLWNGDPDFNGLGLSNQQAKKLVDQFHGLNTYDSASQSVKGQFTIRANDPSATVNGKPLPPGAYILWYENDQSIKAKLELVQKYNLKGTGSWSLEQSTKETWDYYSLWLNGFYFADVQGHWAQTDILQAALNQWMTGIGENLFAPDQPLTRAQAAVVLVRALGLQGAAPPLQNAFPFTDVPDGYWARGEIALAVQKGIIQGTADAVFSPDEPLTREQFCQMMVRVLSLPAAPLSSNSAFSDVPSTRWSYPAIASMRDQHLIDGFEDKTFRPQTPFTRAQMAAILNRINL